MIDHFKLIQIFPFTCNFMWFIKLRASAGISGYVWGVQVCEWARVYTVVGRVIRMCACVWNEFLEFLPENRVPTSADFNTHPIQIFWCLNEEFLERENFKLEYQFFFIFWISCRSSTSSIKSQKGWVSKIFFYFSLSYHIYLPILCAKNKWTCRCRVKKYLISHRLLPFGISAISRFKYIFIVWFFDF